jgi:hypothetical protein
MSGKGREKAADKKAGEKNNELINHGVNILRGRRILGMI